MIFLFCTALTLAVYLAVRFLYLRYQHPLLNIVALSAALVIAVLALCDIPYEKYAPAGDCMTLLMGPATIGLALPLYRYRKLLRRQIAAIAGSVAAGSALAMLSAVLIAWWGGLPHNVVMSMMAKGISTPFAVEIAAIYGGIPSLAAAFVVATGTLGSLAGPWVLTKARITDPTARGLALGTASHAQGTAAALMESEQTGSLAGLALILSGMFTAAFAPLVVRLVGALG